MNALYTKKYKSQYLVCVGSTNRYFESLFKLFGLRHQCLLHRDLSGRGQTPELPKQHRSETGAKNCDLAEPRIDEQCS